uniref:Eukaryotic translation initiation factor 2D-like n=2 Tax=Hirondellea gigas TaxID=1518452 RepID=A0A2P2I1D3_9CRUS
MFLKPYRVKSHTQLKTSDKKKLRVLLSQQFSALPEEEVHKLVPLKDDVSTMKIFCHKGEPSLAYMCGNECIVFSVESRLGTVLLPSLYLCWKYPQLSLAPKFVTHGDVLPRMQKGADLMMPGVIYGGQLTQSTFGKFDAGTAAVIVSHGAVVAVGTTALSSTDLYMAGGHGKAVIVAHVVGDQLWAAGTKAMPIYTDGGRSPNSPESPISSASASVTPAASKAPSCFQQQKRPAPAATMSYSAAAGGSARASVVAASASAGSMATTNNSADSMAASGSAGSMATNGSAGSMATSGSAGSMAGASDNSASNCQSDGTGTSICVEQQLDKREVQDRQQQTDTPNLDTPPQVLSSSETMDSVLLHCFLKALQQSKGALPLPLLVSNFYRLHVLPACPDGASLDIKKTSYKKLSKFLKAMEEKNILTITEYPKGVENITSVTYDHRDILLFRYKKSETTKKVVDGVEEFVPPTMEEVYQVSGDTIEFFRACGKCKGEVLSRLEVREVVTTYIKRKKLVDPSTKMVNLEPPLHGAIIAPKEGLVRTLKWDQVFSRLLGRMAPAVRIQRAGFPDIIKKGKIDPIEMVVVKRAGNKKVTLLYNVGHFGIVESEFARQVQHMAAASTSVGPAEHKPQGTIQILVQGNATLEIAKLLTETYNIPKKYIKGLELIPKGRKGVNK